MMRKASGTPRSRRSTKPGRRAATEVPAPLLVFSALLQADRWLFEASEAARGVRRFDGRTKLHETRMALARCLEDVLPHAYDAMTRRLPAHAGRGRHQL